MVTGATIMTKLCLMRVYAVLECLYSPIPHTKVIWPLAAHPYKASTEHAGFLPDQAPNQLPSARQPHIICSTNRVHGELHRAKIVRPEAHGLRCLRMSAYHKSLHYLGSPLPEAPTAYTRCFTSLTSHIPANST